MPRNSRDRPPPLWRRFMRSPVFEPALSVAIILLVILSLYAYTDNWPPMVVIESESMQHGPNDVLGAINTGDIVLVKSVAVPSGVTTYVDGEVTGYSTYGELGDVLLYYPHRDLPLGVAGPTPVIHRAIVWLTYTGPQGFEIPSLLPLHCAPGAYEQYLLRNQSGAGSHCVNSPNDPELGTLLLFNVGYNDLNLSIDLSNLASQEPWSGFVTLGDNNLGVYDQTPAPWGCQISCLVQPGWVVGVARGMIPWFGALKLWLDGQNGMVPPQSWVYLAVTIVIIIALPQVLPFVIRRVRASLRGASTAPHQGKGDPLRWERVEELTFRKEGEGAVLHRVVWTTLQPHLLGGVRQVRARERLHLKVDEVVDLRRDGRAREIAQVLGKDETITLDPSAPVRVRSVDGVTTLTIGIPSGGEESGGASHHSQGDWLESR